MNSRIFKVLAVAAISAGIAAGAGVANATDSGIGSAGTGSVAVLPIIEALHCAGPIVAGQPASPLCPLVMSAYTGPLPL